MTLAKKTPVICIDLDKLPAGVITKVDEIDNLPAGSYFDISRGIPKPHPTNPTVDGYAIVDQEIVILKEIPRDAIVGWVRKPGSATVYDPPAPL